MRFHAVAARDLQKFLNNQFIKLPADEMKLDVTDDNAPNKLIGNYTFHL